MKHSPSTPSTTATHEFQRTDEETFVRYLLALPPDEDEDDHYVPIRLVDGVVTPPLE